MSLCVNNEWSTSVVKLSVIRPGQRRSWEYRCPGQTDNLVTPRPSLTPPGLVNQLISYYFTIILILGSALENKILNLTSSFHTHHCPDIFSFVSKFRNT